MQNERGWGGVLEGRGWQVFADRYRRPRRTYFYPMPAVISARGASLGRRLTRLLRVRALVQEDRRPRWADGVSLVSRSRRLRLDLERGRDTGLLARLRLRLEGKRLDGEPGGAEYGGLAGLLWKSRWRSWCSVFHLTGFRTASYSTRVYEYEYDLPGAVSIRPHYGSGWRLYALAGVRWGALEIGGRYRLQRDGETRHYVGIQVDARLERP